MCFEDQSIATVKFWLVLMIFIWTNAVLETTFQWSCFAKLAVYSITIYLLFRFSVVVFSSSCHWYTCNTFRLLLYLKYVYSRVLYSAVSSLRRSQSVVLTVTSYFDRFCARLCVLTFFQNLYKSCVTVAKLKYCFDWSVYIKKKKKGLCFWIVLFVEVFCLVFLLNCLVQLSVIKIPYLNKKFHFKSCVNLSGFIGVAWLNCVRDTVVWSVWEACFIICHATKCDAALFLFT